MINRGRMINIQEIYKSLDSKLKNNEALIEFGQKNGYDTYTEFVMESLKEKTAKEIVAEIKNSGIAPPSVSALYLLRLRFMRDAGTYKNKAAGKKRKICMKCGKRPVDKSLFAHCWRCHTDNKKIAEHNNCPYIDAHSKINI